VSAQVDDLVDTNMMRQGERGYSNEIIAPGDLILQIDGRDAQMVSVDDLHKMLNGKISCFACTLSLAD
jgi:C-terminal processing protease CtpA/Prc